MDWIEKTKELPAQNTRILVFSPEYLAEKDETMLFRIIDSQFISIMSDVTYWAYITKPNGYS